MGSKPSAIRRPIITEKTGASGPRMLMRWLITQPWPDGWISQSNAKRAPGSALVSSLNERPGWTASSVIACFPPDLVVMVPVVPLANAPSMATAATSGFQVGQVRTSDQMRQTRSGGASACFDFWYSANSSLLGGLLGRGWRPGVHRTKKHAPNRHVVRAYWEVAMRGYRRFATYRGATVAGVFTNSVFGLLRGSVLLALLAMRPAVGGYDAADALTYTWLTQGLLAVVSMWGWNELALRIVTGDIVVDLGRPLDLQVSWLASDLGRAAYHAVFRGLPPFLIGVLLFRLRLPTEPLTWIAFAAAVVMAVVTSFALRFIVNLASFWLLDYRGLLGVAATTWMFFSGMAIPLAFLPAGWREVVAALPFAGMIQVPVDVFLGKHAGLDLLAALALQAAWAAALLGLGRLVLAAGVRKLVVQGG